MPRVLTLCLALLAGCYSSQRIESARHVTTSLDTAGHISHADESSYQNRAYRGPRLLKPHGLP